LKVQNSQKISHILHASYPDKVQKTTIFFDVKQFIFDPRNYFSVANHGEFTTFRFPFVLSHRKDYYQLLTKRK